MESPLCTPSPTATTFEFPGEDSSSEHTSRFSYELLTLLQYARFLPAPYDGSEDHKDLESEDQEARPPSPDNYPHQQHTPESRKKFCQVFRLQHRPEWLEPLAKRVGIDTSRRNWLAKFLDEGHKQSKPRNARSAADDVSSKPSSSSPQFPSPSSSPSLSSSTSSTSSTSPISSLSSSSTGERQKIKYTREEILQVFQSQKLEPVMDEVWIDATQKGRLDELVDLSRKEHQVSKASCSTQIVPTAHCRPYFNLTTLPPFPSGKAPW
ncbi:hypothetical protein NM688_g679 [Phlebia brevispora]|uniref:Uncharacterized protein n=1 Tax=Phlebia brevispora TaxID=194682 RepID=A0ACC1TEF7_9APHY|nr:hypothetical protein NM688_g679 [Phlebia brevispora]